MKLRIARLILVSMRLSGASRMYTAAPIWSCRPGNSLSSQPARRWAQRELMPSNFMSPLRYARVQPETRFSAFLPRSRLLQVFPQHAPQFRRRHKSWGHTLRSLMVPRPEYQVRGYAQRITDKIGREACRARGG